MNMKLLMGWFSLVSVALVLAGIVFSILGLAVLPVNRGVLLPWQSALYGAIMMGWGMTLGGLRFAGCGTHEEPALWVDCLACCGSVVLSVFWRLLQYRGGHRSSWAIRHSPYTRDSIH